MPDRRKRNFDLRRWLSGHHGVISRQEAIRLGATAGFIRVRLANGDWERMHPTVYRDLAVPRTYYQDLRAAWVATRVGVVSHASAAWLWGLLPDAPAPPELSVRGEAGRSRRPGGLVVHRSADLDVAQAVSRHEVLVTNPMRTLVDLAASTPPAVVTQAVDAALANKLVVITGLNAELDRLSRQGRKGVDILRWQLRDRGFVGAPGPSVLEAKTRRVILAARLPLPKIEWAVGDDGQFRLDFAWPPILFTVEVDGYVWHFSPESHQRDVRRRNQLQQLGWSFLVYTWRDICDQPTRVAQEIGARYRQLQVDVVAQRHRR